MTVKSDTRSSTRDVEMSAPGEPDVLQPEMQATATATAHRATVTELRVGLLMRPGHATNAGRSGALASSRRRSCQSPTRQEQHLRSAAPANSTEDHLSGSANIVP